MKKALLAVGFGAGSMLGLGLTEMGAYTNPDAEVRRNEKIEAVAHCAGPLGTEQTIVDALPVECNPEILS